MPKRPAGPSGRAASPPKGKKPRSSEAEARNYDHPEASAALRPDVGVQKQFRKKKPPKTYRYDPGISPSLQWNEQPARERGEALIRRIQEAGSLEEAKAAAAELAAMSRPFLDWARKAERGAFEVPTLPLFVHERLSTRAMLRMMRSTTGEQSVGVVASSGEAVQQ
ncbi:MAG TPA: hypothetical protein VMN37_09625 [Gemmatimonadales bacterium]|nr:hypothetical protein [Gemmatimonadales bacterium]